jgi:hypothetical protein
MTYFDPMVGTMQVLGKKIIQWMEDLFLAIRFVYQKLSKYFAEVSPMPEMHLI